LEFEQSGSDVVLVKPIKIELLDKMFQYIYIYGVMSVTYGADYHNHGDDDNDKSNKDDGDDSMCTLKEFLSS